MIRSINRPSLPFLVAAALLLAPLPAVHARDFSRTFSIRPPADWVAQDDGKGIAAPSTQDSEALLLVDYQENVATEEQYARFVDEVRTAEGVQNGSTILVNYDPGYQTLAFHHIRVVRDGTATSRLTRDAVSLLQRETDLEWSMLDGSLTATIVLKDIRPGDRIDYAYTVKGRNPAFAGMYASSFSVGWSIPVGRERIRVLFPSSRNMSHRAMGCQAEPRVTRSGKTTEYLWELSDLAPILSEDDTPSWHVMYPWIDVSEFAGWAEVSRWALTLYPRARLPDGLEALVSEWTERFASPLDRVKAALDYVQQEIRYVGIELGTGSFRPRSPKTVFAQRFGDCKDKSYLLCTLLERMGIESHPVLVNTYEGPILDAMLPSSRDFNHVIAVVMVEGKRIYVDPTQAYQRGPVLERFLPDLGYGLMVAPGQDSLVRFGSCQGKEPETEIVEKYTVAGQEEPALLEVETKASGGAADDLRADLAGSRVDEIAKRYLDFYAAGYPAIESAGSLEVRDDEAANIITTVEHYRIPGFWRLLEDKRNYRAEFFPDSVYNPVPTPRTKIRSSPLEVEYPKKVRERIEVRLPEPWPVKAEKSTITTAAFRLTSDYSTRENLVVLDYGYTALAREVPVSAMAAYNKAIVGLDDKLGYSLTWQAPNAVKTSWPPDGFALTIMILSLLLLLGVGFGLYRLASRPAPNAAGTSTAPGVPTAAPQTGVGPVIAPLLGGRTYRFGGSAEGLGGLLVLVAVNIFAQALSSFYSITKIWPDFSVGNWHDLTDAAGARFNNLWAPYYLSMTIANMALIVGSALLLLLFFQRRRGFPKTYIVYLAFAAAAVAADAAFTHVLQGQSKEAIGSETPRTVTQALVACAIWIPYMLASKRVKATFIR